MSCCANRCRLLIEETKELKTHTGSIRTYRNTDNEQQRYTSTCLWEEFFQKWIKQLSNFIHINQEELM